MPTVIRANSLYTLTDGPGWSIARQGARGLGGDLASINSSSENEFIVNVFGQTQDEGWIGFSDAASEGNWSWSDGSAVTYTNWNYTQPSGSTYGDASEDYAAIYFNGKHWSYGSQPPGSWNDCPDNGASLFLLDPYFSLIKGIAEIPIISSIVLPASIKEGAGVFNTTISLSAGSGTSGNLANGATVYWSISGISADDLQFGALTGSGQVQGGILALSHSLKADGIAEAESFQVALYSDPSLQSQYRIGAPRSAAIADDNGATVAPSQVAATSQIAINGSNNAVVTGTGNIIATITDNSTTNITNNINISNTDNSVKTFNGAISIGSISLDLSGLLSGQAKGSDIVMGTDLPDVIGSGKGVDRLTGGNSADKFVFNAKDRFGSKGADVVTDFNPSAGDQLVLSPSALPGLRNPRLGVAENKGQLSSAFKRDCDLVYLQSLGQLFYDQNGAAAGYGKGGLFAVLQGAPSLTSQSLATLA